MIDWVGVSEGIRLNVRVAGWCGIGIVTLETRLDQSLQSSNSVEGQRPEARGQRLEARG